MKQITALVAGMIVTAIVGLGMLAIGVNAAANTESVPVSNAPANPAAISNDANPQTQPTNNLIAQYQDREKQYQTQLDQANAQIQELKGLVTQYQDRENQYQTQLNQATTQATQLQNILNELQRRGIIRIQNDGTIQLRGGR